MATESKKADTKKLGIIQPSPTDRKKYVFKLVYTNIMKLKYVFQVLQNNKSAHISCIALSNKLTLYCRTSAFKLFIVINFMGNKMDEYIPPIKPIDFMINQTDINLLYKKLGKNCTKFTWYMDNNDKCNINWLIDTKFQNHQSRNKIIIKTGSMKLDKELVNYIRTPKCMLKCNLDWKLLNHIIKSATNVNASSIIFCHSGKDSEFHIKYDDDTSRNISVERFKDGGKDINLDISGMGNNYLHVCIVPKNISKLTTIALTSCATISLTNDKDVKINCVIDNGSIVVNVLVPLKKE